MDNSVVEEKINEHSKILDKHDADIQSLKLDNVQNKQIQENLQKSMERLTESIDKMSLKIENFLEGNSQKTSNDYKWIIAAVLIPIIFFLLNKYYK